MGRAQRLEARHRKTAGYSKKPKGERQTHRDINQLESFRATYQTEVLTLCQSLHAKIYLVKWAVKRMHYGKRYFIRAAGLSDPKHTG